MSRRKALTIAGQAVGGIAGAAIVLPAVGFAVAPIFEQPAGALGERGPGQPVHREDLHARSSSPSSRGSARRARPPPTSARRPPTFDETQPYEPYIAISTRCAHLGCPVRFVEAAGNFICPCHGGVYDFAGQGDRRPAGAPPRPLPDPRPQRPGEVGPRYSVTSQLEPVRARDPGEYTGGVWNVLYPPRPDTLPAAVGRPEMKLPDSSIPRPAHEAARSPARATARQRRRPGERLKEAAGGPASAGSTSAPAAPASSPGCSTGRCRRAPTGSTRSARRRCSHSPFRR